MRMAKWIAAAAVLLAGLAAAEPLALGERDAAKAEAMAKAWERLVQATDDVREFAANVANTCAVKARDEERYGGYGWKADFNPAAGKAFGRLANAERPVDQKSAVALVNACKGAYAARKWLASNAKVKTRIGYQVGALSNCSDSDIEAANNWFAAYAEFLKAKIDVRRSKHYRWITRDWVKEEK